MANVLITSRCNLRCEYCFAQARLQDRRNQVMAMEDVRKVIAFLKKSDHPNFRAMGGEPTMHPDFPEIVETTLQEGLHLDVLSNATWPETCNRLFNRISPDNLSFLLNIDHPTNYQSPVWKNIHRNLAAVAPLRSITLSFNIFETRPRYEYIFDLVKTYHIDKIRLSLSLPVIGARNAHLPFEDLKRMGPIVVEFARQAADLGAKVSLDNAAPLCMFSYEQAGELLLRGVLDLTRNARCEPIVDIGPDLTVWCCFCLSMLWNRRLSDFECLQEIVEYYKGIMGSYQDKLYPLDECDRCPYRKEWGCQGGCLSYTILKHGDAVPFEAAADASPGEWRPSDILALHPEAEVCSYDIPDLRSVVTRRSADIQMTLDRSFIPLLTFLDGAHSSQDVLNSFLDSGGDRRMRGPVEAFATKAMEDGAKKLLLGMLHRGLLTRR